VGCGSADILQMMKMTMMKIAGIGKIEEPGDGWLMGAGGVRLHGLYGRAAPWADIPGGIRRVGEDQVAWGSRGSGVSGKQAEKNGNR
jgi:hypothetical protein